MFVLLFKKLKIPLTLAQIYHLLFITKKGFKTSFFRRSKTKEFKQHENEQNPLSLSHSLFFLSLLCRRHHILTRLLKQPLSPFPLLPIVSVLRQPIKKSPTCFKTHCQTWLRICHCQTARSIKLNI